MIVLRSSMQDEGTIEHSKWQVSCVYILVCKRKILFSIPLTSAMCIHFSQRLDHCVT